MPNVKPNVKVNIKSNIRIKTNLYVRGAQSLEGGDHPEKDAAFLSRILSKTALETLTKRFGDVELSDIQKRVLNGETNIRLADIKTAEASADNFAEKAAAIEMSENDAAAETDAVIPEDPEKTAEKEFAEKAAALDMSENIPEAVPEIPEIPTVSAASSDQSASEIPEKEDASADMPENADASENGDMPEVRVRYYDKTTENAKQRRNGSSKFSLDALLGEDLVGMKTAIVCGDLAEYVSFRLFEAGIPHISGDKNGNNKNNGNSANSSCARFLADILWDCRERVITKDNFTKRFTARCSAHAHRLDECYEALCGLAGSENDLDIGGLAAKIMESGLPDEIFEVRKGDVTVFGAGHADLTSFDKVYVTENALDSVSARIMLQKRPVIVYVSDLPEFVGNGHHSLMLENGAAKIHIGAKDIDPISFIGGNVGEAIRRQAYISRSVKSKDLLRLELNGEVYDVIHNDMAIAKLTKDFSESLTGEFGGKRYFETLPRSFDAVKVTDVVTIVSERAGDKVHAQFRDRSFWFGVELCGFAEA